MVFDRHSEAYAKKKGRLTGIIHTRDALPTLPTSNPSRAEAHFDRAATDQTFAVGPDNLLEEMRGDAPSANVRAYRFTLHSKTGSFTAREIVP